MIIGQGSSGRPLGVDMTILQKNWVLSGRRASCRVDDVLVDQIHTEKLCNDGLENCCLFASRC